MSIGVCAYYIYVPTPGRPEAISGVFGLMKHVTVYDGAWRQRYSETYFDFGCQLAFILVNAHATFASADVISHWLPSINTK